MNNLRSNLVNAIMYDRQTEFRLLLEQMQAEVLEFRVNKDNKNVANFLAEERKLDLFRAALRVLEKTLPDPVQRREAVRRWVNEADNRGLSALYTAVYTADLVG